MWSHVRYSTPNAQDPWLKGAMKSCWKLMLMSEISWWNHLWSQFWPEIFLILRNYCRMNEKSPMNLNYCTCRISPLVATHFSLWWCHNDNTKGRRMDQQFHCLVLLQRVRNLKKASSHTLKNFEEKKNIKNTWSIESPNRFFRAKLVYLKNPWEQNGCSDRLASYRQPKVFVVALKWVWFLKNNNFFFIMLKCWQNHTA